MKWDSHLEAAKQRIAIATITFLAAADTKLCFVDAKIPSEAMEMTCNTTSSAFRPLYATLQLLQFTTWDQYLKQSPAPDFQFCSGMTNIDVDEHEIQNRVQKHDRKGGYLQNFWW